MSEGKVTCTRCGKYLGPWSGDINAPVPKYECNCAADPCPDCQRLTREVVRLREALHECNAVFDDVATVAQIHGDQPVWDALVVCRAEVRRLLGEGEK